MISVTMAGYWLNAALRELGRKKTPVNCYLRYSNWLSAGKRPCSPSPQFLCFYFESRVRKPALFTLFGGSSTLSQAQQVTVCQWKVSPRGIN